MSVVWTLLLGLADETRVSIAGQGPEKATSSVAKGKFLLNLIILF